MNLIPSARASALRHEPVGSAVGQIHAPGRDDARSLDDAFLDMVLERQVPFRRTAAGQDRRVSGIEQLLHLLFLIGSGIDVAVAVDESRHGGHAPPIDGLDAGNRLRGPAETETIRPPRTTIEP